MRRSTLVAVLVFVMLGGPAAFATRSHPTGGLAAVAESAWRARNEYRVSGTARTEPAYASWFASQRAGLDAERKALGDITFTAQETRLVAVEDTFARRDRARLTVRIDSRLDYGGPPGAPPRMGSSEEVEFHFRWVDGAWVLHRTHSLGKG